MKRQRKYNLLTSLMPPQVKRNLAYLPNRSNLLSICRTAHAARTQHCRTEQKHAHPREDNSHCDENISPDKKAISTAKTAVAILSTKWITRDPPPIKKPRLGMMEARWAIESGPVSSRVFRSPVRDPRRFSRESSLRNRTRGGGDLPGESDSSASRAAAQTSACSFLVYISCCLSNGFSLSHSLSPD